MAKRRMRRTSDRTQNTRSTPSLTEGFVDQARAASIGMVDVATDAAKAALSGMQQVGRAMADMAAPAARRGMSAAAGAGRAAIEGASDASRSISDAMLDAADNTRRATSNTGRAARRVTASTPPRPTPKRKKRSRRAA